MADLIKNVSQGDVLLFQSLDDGEILFEDAHIKLTQSFETAVYLSLFGGNMNGEWWGNESIDDSAAKQISLTQSLIEGLPAITGNLASIKEAVKGDLAWLKDKNIASDISIQVSIPGLNKIKIVINIKASGAVQNFEFTENWKAK